MIPEPIMKRAGDRTSAVDWLSALPDGLLHAIMSCLPAPQAVRTSLLSRRWSHLWRSTPRVEINEEDFGISMDISHNTLEERWARFEDFATNLLLFHDNTSSLGEFRLRSCVHNWRHVDRWIRRGIEYCPSVLQIQIMGNSAFKLPHMDSSFRRLKMLCLRQVHLDSHFTGFLCSACPILEDLDLELCEFYDNYPQAITSPTLNRLAIDCCFNETNHPLVIRTPSLTSLSLLDSCTEAGISLFKMNSLVEAKISISSGREPLSRKAQHEILGSLSNVTRLEMRGFEAEVMLIEKCDKFPIFRYMQTLDLYFCFLDEVELKDNLEALGSFLQNAPCLEKLTLAYSMFLSLTGPGWDIGRKNIILHRQDIKPFQCHKLKLIKIIYNHDDDHRLIELVWILGRSLPDVNIELTKEDG